MTHGHLTQLVDAMQGVIRGSCDLSKSMSNLITIVQDHADLFDDQEALLAALNKIQDATKASILKNNDAAETVRKIKAEYL